MSKIISLKQLDVIKRKNKKVVLCGGCFDIFHVGHLRFLENAKKNGDILVVTLEPDGKVRMLKGKNRPINSQAERAEMLGALEIVDFVINLPDLKTDKEYSDLINTLKPDVIAVTEGDPIINKKILQAKTVGATLVEIPQTTTPSTTQLIKILGID